MPQDKFSFISRIKSFPHAFNGLKILFREEHNARIHLAAVICVVAAGIIFRVSLTEWIALVIVIVFVISLEIINSIIERIANFMSPEFDIRIKKIKDLAAAAVLVGAITAFTTGLMIFIPKIL